MTEFSGAFGTLVQHSGRYTPGVVDGMSLILVTPRSGNRKLAHYRGGDTLDLAQMALRGYSNLASEDRLEHVSWDNKPLGFSQIEGGVVAHFNAAKKQVGASKLVKGEDQKKVEHIEMVEALLVHHKGAAWYFLHHLHQ